MTKLLTLQEAADILRVKDTRTVLKWAREGRFVLIGQRKSITVNAESLQAYIEGRSAWHLAKSQPTNAHDASQEPELSATRRGERSPMKRALRSKGLPQGMIAFDPTRTRRRG